MTNVDTNPESTHQTITAQRGHVQALAFARKGGVALSALLGSIATAKETERKGPIQTFLFLETHYSDDEAEQIPLPGSKKEETGNKPYDRYSSVVDTDQGKKNLPGSWITDVIRNTDECKAIDERIDFIDAPTTEGCPQDISNMGTGERAVERARLMQRKADMRKALVAGILLYHRVKEVAELNPERIKVKLPIRTVKVIGPDGQPIKNDKGEIETRDEVFANTIRLQDPASEFEDKVLNVGQFQALKPSKIPEGEPVNIVTLEKTGARAPKNKGKGKGNKQSIAVPTSVEQLLNLFNVGATAIDTETDPGKMLHSKLLAACAAEGAKGDDVVETIGDFITNLDDNVWTVINARYAAIKTAKAKAMNAKAHTTNQAA